MVIYVCLQESDILDKPEPSISLDMPVLEGTTPRVEELSEEEQLKLSILLSLQTKEAPEDDAWIADEFEEEENERMVGFSSKEKSTITEDSLVEFVRAHCT